MANIVKDPQQSHHTFLTHIYPHIYHYQGNKVNNIINIDQQQYRYIKNILYLLYLLSMVDIDLWSCRMYEMGMCSCRKMILGYSLVGIAYSYLGIGNINGNMDYIICKFLGMKIGNSLKDMLICIGC